MTTPTFTAIAAINRKRGIGLNGSVPWKLSADMKRFKEITTRAPDGKRNVVIMGRKTKDTIPAKFWPLSGRTTIVVTRDRTLREEKDLLVAHGFIEALQKAAALTDLGLVFVAGGGEIYAEALRHPGCTWLDLTFVEDDTDCDTFFPEFLHDFENPRSSPPCVENGLWYSFWTYERKK